MMLVPRYKVLLLESEKQGGVPVIELIYFVRECILFVLHNIVFFKDEQQIKPSQSSVLSKIYKVVF